MLQSNPLPSFVKAGVQVLPRHPKKARQRCSRPLLYAEFRGVLHELGYEMNAPTDHYENPIKACPLVSGGVRPNEKPSQLELLRGLRNQRCPQ